LREENWKKLKDMETELCKLAWKYGSDKCPMVKHHYTPVYYDLFKDIRNDVKKVLEIGIGNADKMKHCVEKCPEYHKGASLFMWREFFPNAHIYGMDILGDCMFIEERITTLCRSQSRLTDILKVLKKTGTDIDIVIDDGSHETADQIFSCQAMLPRLAGNPIYVIEDVNESRVVASALSNFDVEIVQFEHKASRDDAMLIVKKK